jgi:hypothetical protein
MDVDNLFEEILGIPKEDTPKQQIVSEILPEESTGTTVNREDGTIIVRADRANAITKSDRMEEICDMLLHHTSNKDIKRIIAEKYGISPETVRGDIDDANKLIQQNVPEIKSIVAKNISTYSRIIKDSEGDDKRTTILAMAGLEKLLRLHGPETQNNTQINLKFDNVDTEELIELIKSISSSGGK